MIRRVFFSKTAAVIASATSTATFGADKLRDDAPMIQSMLDRDEPVTARDIVLRTDVTTTANRQSLIVNNRISGHVGRILIGPDA